MSRYVRHGGAEPRIASPTAGPGIFLHTRVRCQPGYDRGRRQQPFVAGPDKFVCVFPHSCECHSQPCGTGRRRNDPLRLLLHDLVSAWPEGSNLFDPGLCAIQVSGSLEPNRTLILSFHEIVPGGFHIVPFGGLNLFWRLIFTVEVPDAIAPDDGRVGTYIVPDSGLRVCAKQDISRPTVCILVAAVCRGEWAALRLESY
jgi:hypothetical protein